MASKLHTIYRSRWHVTAIKSARTLFLALLTCKHMWCFFLICYVLPATSTPIRGSSKRGTPESTACCSVFWCYSNMGGNPSKQQSQRGSWARPSNARKVHLHTCNVARGAHRRREKREEQWNGSEQWGGEERRNRFDQVMGGKLGRFMRLCEGVLGSMDERASD